MLSLTTFCLPSQESVRPAWKGPVHCWPVLFLSPEEFPSRSGNKGLFSPHTHALLLSALTVGWNLKGGLPAYHLASKGLFIPFHSWSAPMAASRQRCKSPCAVPSSVVPEGLCLSEKSAIPRVEMEGKNELLHFSGVVQINTERIQPQLYQLQFPVIISWDWKMGRCLPSVKSCTLPLLRSRPCLSLFLSLTLGTLGSVCWRRKPLPEKRQNSP